jgi:hypothetical protein
VALRGGGAGGEGQGERNADTCDGHSSRGGSRRAEAV